MLKVLVVEDDVILRDFLVNEVTGLSNLVNLEVQYCSTVESAIFQVNHWVPDVILLDLNLPDGSGLGVAEFYKEIHPEGRVLVLTGQADFHVTSDGVLGDVLHSILSKSAGLEPLRNTLWNLFSAIGSHAPDIAKLTGRQVEMLRLIGQGYDTLEIAEKMGITFATAQTHRRQITGRLGVKGTRLVALAKSLPFGD